MINYACNYGGRSIRMYGWMSSRIFDEQRLLAGRSTVCPNGEPEALFALCHSKSPKTPIFKEREVFSKWQKKSK